MRSLLAGLAAALPFVQAYTVNLQQRDALKRATVCGILAYDENTKAYFYSESTSLATEAGCGAHCLADTSCKSFAVGSGACLHYTVAVTGNINANSNSPYAFYDRACVSATTSSHSSSSSSSSARSSATSAATQSSGRSSSTSSASLLTSSSRSSSVAGSSIQSSTTSSSIPSTSASCGLAGYDNNNPVSYTDSSNAAYRSLSGCATYCRSQSGKCLSFAWSSTTCLLYAKVVAGNFKANAKSPYSFYDLACIAPASSSMSSSSIAISTAASSSTSSVSSSSSVPPFTSSSTSSVANDSTTSTSSTMSSSEVPSSSPTSISSVPTSSSAFSASSSSSSASSSLPSCTPAPSPCNAITTPPDTLYTSTCTSGCTSGYVVQCGAGPGPGSIAGGTYLGDVISGEFCQSTCDSLSKCAGFVFGTVANDVGECYLYDYINSWQPGDLVLYTKICAPSAVSSNSSIISATSSSTISLIPSTASSSDISSSVPSVESSSTSTTSSDMSIPPDSSPTVASSTLTSSMAVSSDASSSTSSPPSASSDTSSFATSTSVSSSVPSSIASSVTSSSSSTPSASASAINIIQVPDLTADPSEDGVMQWGYQIEYNYAPAPWTFSTGCFSGYAQGYYYSQCTHDTRTFSCIEIQASDCYVYLSQTLTTVPNAVYNFSFLYASMQNLVDGEFTCTAGASTMDQRFYDQSVAVGWNQYSSSFTATSSSTVLSCAFYGGGDGMDVQFTEFSASISA
ncbi:hypothetical protein BT63DRAFT_261501 [Microthyrium microscopicum]|uniref:Apple domain-containing protein n=1 Tax=Microthyrium microscopicum TaxID=703497 RepID=A0A6A6UEE6_9PEZI|nr:hypothetical protein BT63DRAFT_261501 [Microthyrium microscopicum]